MKLTDAAADRIKAIMAKADKPFAGVRVGVKNGGCAGMAYTMEYAESAQKFDEVVEDKGVKLLIDPKAVMFLLGTEMDFKVDKLSSTFVFNNPNQTSACGCGESVQLTPASDPAAAKHVRRLAPRALDPLLAHILQAGKIVQSRAADDAENRLRHLLMNWGPRFRAAERPRGLPQEPWPSRAPGGVASSSRRR